MFQNKYFIVGVEKHDGTQAYLKNFSAAGGGSRTASNNGLTDDPMKARLFPEDIERTDLLFWMDLETNKITKWANIDTMKIMTFECSITPVDIDRDDEWRKELQRAAVGKLSTLEIQALKLEKYEIERRLAED